MKAITIHQPWATLIALGEKRFETRSWATKYRGPIAIHAGKQIDHQTALMLAKDYPEIWRRISPLQTGCILAVAHLEKCWKVSNWRTNNDIPVLEYELQEYYIDRKEYDFGDYTPGRYAWEMVAVKRIEPVPAKGQQGLWNWGGERDANRT